MVNVASWFQQERPRRWALQPMLATAWLLVWLTVLFLLWLVWPTTQESENE